jgi:hypothetical protein
MLKKPASFVLTSFRGSTYHRKKAAKQLGVVGEK